MGLTLTGNLQTQGKNATIRREHLALRGACSAPTPLCFRTGKHGVLSYGYRHFLWPARPWAYQPDIPNRYISLGTLFHRQNEFYRCCFQAFEQSDYQVIMSVGQHTAIEQLGPIPENFIVCQSVPQWELLQRATLFITHAGMNSTNEALYYGVPLLAIPQATDQHYIARRIEQVGAGIRLSRKQVTASRLRNSADEIRTHANYAQASARIGESLRQAGGVRAALTAIQQFKQMYHIEQ